MQTKLRKGDVFKNCVKNSVHRGRCTLPLGSHTHPTPRQTSPWPDTPRQTHTPGQTQPRAGTPWLDTPPGQTPAGQTPPPSRSPRVDTQTGRHPPWADTPGQTPPSPDSYCSGRYASHWNAFLYSNAFVMLSRITHYVGFDCSEYIRILKL